MRAESLAAVNRLLTLLKGERPEGYSADSWRRWKAAEAVSDGPASTVDTAVRLGLSRRCHALHEGLTLPEGRR